MKFSPGWALLGLNRCLADDFCDFTVAGGVIFFAAGGGIAMLTSLDLSELKKVWGPAVLVILGTAPLGGNWHGDELQTAADQGGVTA